MFFNRIHAITVSIVALTLASTACDKTEAKAKSADAKPADAKPADAKPADAKPADEPSEAPAEPPAVAPAPPETEVELELEKLGLIATAPKGSMVQGRKILGRDLIVEIGDATEAITMSPDNVEGIEAQAASRKGTNLEVETIDDGYIATWERIAVAAADGKEFTSYVLVSSRTLGDTRYTCQTNHREQKVRDTAMALCRSLSKK